MREKRRGSPFDSLCSRSCNRKEIVKLKTYYYVTVSNPPLCSPNTGTIKHKSPMKALKSLVSNYPNPAGLFWAHICSIKNTTCILAEYLSAKAHTQSHVKGEGWLEWRGNNLYVNGKKAKKYREVFRPVLATNLSYRT